jgi:tetratricopeptide (TPR) repeat protein
MAAQENFLAAAWAQHQARNLPEARRLYRLGLQADPGNADGWCLLGIVCRALGEPAEAEICYREALRLRPDYPEALINLGNALLGLGRTAEAVPLYQRALTLRSDDVSARNSLGAALRTLGRPEEALPHYREALRLNPAYADAWSNQGDALLALGKADEALASCQQALRLQPGHAAAHNTLGAALTRMGRTDEAVAAIRRALALRADFADAHTSLGNALLARQEPAEAEACYRAALRLKPAAAESHYNLGVALAARQMPAEAETCYREALRLRPVYLEALNNLGNALLEQTRPDEARECYERALRLRPDYPEALNNLGKALLERNRPDEAEPCYREALRLRPDYLEALNNLGNALLEQNRSDEALECFERALRLRPDQPEARTASGAAAEVGGYPDAHLGRAMIWLLRGDYERGWTEYEWRWRTKKMRLPSFAQPLWDGSPPEGRTVLLWAEQGLGDAMHFVRYAALVRQRGGRVVVACRKPLLRLLAGCAGIDELVDQEGELPAFDVYVPLLSLPRLLGTTLATVPAAAPYLHADAALVERWRAELGAKPGFKVGIGWQGNPRHAADRRRSMPLAFFRPLAEVRRVRLYSLQKGPGVEQLVPNGPFPAEDLGARLDEEAGPFMDTAAVMKCLDLVIVSDTSLAHLAGALGVPVWLALSCPPEWRWLLGRSDSPWYPTARLFRQPRPGAWAEVFAEMAAELPRLVAGHTYP